MPDLAWLRHPSERSRAAAAAGHDHALDRRGEHPHLAVPPRGRYSGDQIGLAVSGDLDAALNALDRLLVGGSLGPSVRDAGVFDTGRADPQARAAAALS